MGAIPADGDVICANSLIGAGGGGIYLGTYRQWRSATDGRHRSNGSRRRRLVAMAKDTGAARIANRGSEPCWHHAAEAAVMTDRPLPDSAEANKIGCPCPRSDNKNGEGTVTDGVRVFVINPNCTLHSKLSFWRPVYQKGIE